MEVLEIGKLYVSGKTSWPEAMEYNFYGENHELRFFFKNPSNYEIEAIRKMPVQFGLFIRDEMIFLIYKFMDYKKLKPAIDGDCPFSIHLVPADKRSLPELPTTEEERVMLQILLIDADTGILKVIRAVSLSHQFSVALCSAIIEQSKKSMPDNYDAKIQAIYRKYSDTESMMNHCIEKCSGGD